MSKWHVHVTHMAKHMNMVGAWAPPKSGADQNSKQKPELQTKIQQKEHANMASQAECESCFQDTMSWFSPSFSGALVNASALMLLLESFARKSDSVTAY